MATGLFWVEAKHIAPSPAQDAPQLSPLAFRAAKASDEDALEIKTKTKRRMAIGHSAFKPIYYPRYPTVCLQYSLHVWNLRSCRWRAKCAPVDVSSRSDAYIARERGTRTPEWCRV